MLHSVLLLMHKRKKYICVMYLQGACKRPHFPYSNVSRFLTVRCLEMSFSFTLKEFRNTDAFNHPHFWHSYTLCQYTHTHNISSHSYCYFSFSSITCLWSLLFIYAFRYAVLPYFLQHRTFLYRIYWSVRTFSKCKHHFRSHYSDTWTVRKCISRDSKC